MAHADLTGSNVKDHLWNEERVEAWSTITFCKIYYLMLKGDQTTNTTGKYNTYPVWIDIVFIQTCIGHGLITRNKSKLGETVNLAGFFLVQVLNGIEVLY